MKTNIKPSKLYAHTPNLKGDWHCLDEHLETVASLAESFANVFGVAGIAGCVGLLHDVGKASKRFQDYLEKAHKAKVEGAHAPRSRVDHKIAGALKAGELLNILALVVLGHHGGLSNIADARNKLKHPDNSTDIYEAINNLQTFLEENLPQKPTFPEYAQSDAQACELLIRMLFSTLVDADFLDTEAHWEPDRSSLRGRHREMAELWDIFQQKQDELTSTASKSKINNLRNEIYYHCLAVADNQPGVFRLTVPTGGGKTRAGMAFALKHAVKHNLRRVIVAIPYTSIIDQNAKVYREIFGDADVLEHHSAVRLPDEDNEDYSDESQRHLLAAQNWDTPIIVTTTVQLFESLFSNKPSRCRKLHNIANSVIILDEVQTLPVPLIQPILDMLKGLVEHYGVTLVLSTATQPAFSGQSPYLKGFDSEPKEIVPQPESYFKQLERVHYHIVSDPWSWDQVAAEMKAHEQILCIVNSRKDALEVFNLLDGCDALHLSTLMCPAHRRDVLDEIRRRLKEKQPCRVVSTQVVEAGVDLDFPCVMRAIGPLDRIVQAAGRCNREDNLKEEKGEVIVFKPEEERTPSGMYKLQMNTASNILKGENVCLNDSKLIESYFAEVFRIAGKKALDEKGIVDKRRHGFFEDVARDAKLIEKDTVTLVVPYCKQQTDELLCRIKHNGAVSRKDWSILQQFSVSIYRSDYYQISYNIEEVVQGLNVWWGCYHPQTGLPIESSPADLIG